LFAFSRASGAYSDIVGIDIEGLKIFVDRNTVADLEVVVFNDKVTPLKIIIGVMKNDVVSELRNHLLQNKKDFFFISCKSRLRGLGID
jgi:hypothetical protein